VTQNSTDNASAAGDQLITCSVIHEGPLAKILVSGEIDIASLHRLVAAANDALRAPGIQQLVIDLSEVSFADTVALLWLVRTVRDGRRRHLDPNVHVRDGPVLAVLRVTGLIEQLPVVFEASTTRAPAPRTLPARPYDVSVRPRPAAVMPTSPAVSELTGARHRWRRAPASLQARWRGRHSEPGNPGGQGCVRRMCP
jgi:anti-anti-sigma factor